MSRKLITLANLSLLSNWDPKFYNLEKLKFSKNMPTVKFRKITLPTTIDWVNIDDELTYSILGVRTYGVGVYVNRTVLGKTLKMRKYQKSKINHLFWCKVDTKNGAFGIINEEFEDTYGSSNMSYLKLDIEKVNIDYLQLLFQLPKFTSYMDNMVVGVTNRKYISMQSLLNDVYLPLPKIDIQESLVNKYKKLIEQADKADNEATHIFLNINQYILKKLEIEFVETHNDKSSSLKFMKFSELINRWELSDLMIDTNNSIKIGLYKCVTMGSHFNFISRTWDKKRYTKDTFNYVEISSINPLIGIVASTVVELIKAPSRATQIIRTNDLIIGTTRPNLTKFAIVSNVYDENICSSGFQVISPDYKYNLNYLKEVLMSDIGLKQFDNLITGALYPAVNQAQLASMLIPLPPLDIQNEIANNIAAMKVKVEELKIKAANLRLLAKKQFEEAIFDE